MKFSIMCENLYTPEKIEGETIIQVNDSIIESIGVSQKDGYIPIDLHKFKVMPGLVDMHIHGVNGFDTMDASFSSLNGMSEYLVTLGVTSFLATTVTASMDSVNAALVNISGCMKENLSGARLLGAYVEGPYINCEYKGAHPAQFIRDINLEEIKKLVENSDNAIKVMAIAPEKENAISIIDFLVKKGIKVTLAHTNATHDEAVCAINAGANIVTHLFNGMRGLHHREPGIVGAVLTDDRISVELICDRIHVNPMVTKIIGRCKPFDKILLITDCIMAAGLKEGRYRLGELDILVEEGISRLDNGTLAGSTLKLVDAVVNMAKDAEISFEHALSMATINPAKALGMDDEIGSISAGKRADIIACDEQNRPVFVMVGGKILVNKGNA